MKILNRIAIGLSSIIALNLMGSVCSLPAMAQTESEYLQEDGSVARSSGIIKSYNGYAFTGLIRCDATLQTTGTLTIRTILQKRDSNGTWYNYNTGDSGTTYTSVMSATHTYYCSMPSGGSYRCFYTVRGTVNGVSETKAGYSAVYTN